MDGVDGGKAYLTQLTGLKLTALKGLSNKSTWFIGGARGRPQATVNKTAE